MNRWEKNVLAILNKFRSHALCSDIWTKFTAEFAGPQIREVINQ